MSYIEKYPFAEKSPEMIKSLSGKQMNEITVEGIVNGEIEGTDIKISPETLELQAKVAEEEGRTQFAENMRRAKELCIVPDDEILDIYIKLRPNRATKKELEAIADHLEADYGAKLNADLIREAAVHYAERGVLKKE